MTIPNILDDPRLAKLFGQRAAIRPDASAVGMPDPASIPLRAQSDSLDTAQDAAKQALIARLDESGGGMAGKGKLTPFDIMAMSMEMPGGVEGDPNAKAMYRIANQQRETRGKLAKAATRKAKFGKGQP